MKRFLLLTLACLLAPSLFALEKEDFTAYEYHANIKVDDTLAYGAPELTGRFRKSVDFLYLKGKDEAKSVKLVTYLDTKDRLLQKNNLIIRVREDLVKPKKSKITVKVRGTDPASFGALKGFKDTEIDLTGDRATFSASYDIKYNPKALDIHNLNSADVLAYIREKDKAAWKLLKPLLPRLEGQLLPTTVMVIRKWEGSFSDGTFPDLEIEFQYWSPEQQKAGLYFAEVSFEGKAKDNEELGKAYQKLQQSVIARGLDKGAHEGSKTQATFDLTPAFL